MEREKRCCFSFAFPRKEGRSWWTVDGLCDDPCGRVFLTDGAQRRHSEIHPLPPPLPPSSPYTHLSQGGVFFFFFSQSIGPFRLPTAPAAQQLSRSCYTWGPPQSETKPTVPNNDSCRLLDETAETWWRFRAAFALPVPTLDGEKYKNKRKTWRAERERDSPVGFYEIDTARLEPTFFGGSAHTEGGRG
jgi:hypothetical protein